MKSILTAFAIAVLSPSPYASISSQTSKLPAMMLTDDSGTVSHVRILSFGVYDTKGATWSVNGAVTVASGAIPLSRHYSAGPFSNTNNYSIGSGSDVLDFTGNFTCHAAFAMPALALGDILGNGAYGASGQGWISRVTSDGKIQFDTYAASNAYGRVVTTTIMSTTQVNIASWGRSGSTQYAKLNGGTTASGATTTTAGSSYIATLGYGAYALAGTVYEFTCTSSAFNESSVSGIQVAFLAKYR